MQPAADGNGCCYIQLAIKLKTVQMENWDNIDSNSILYFNTNDCITEWVMYLNIINAYWNSSFFWVLFAELLCDFPPL